jgi:hypothetical protein
VLRVAAPDDGAGGDVESREQRGVAVPRVVVGAALSLARAHRQQRLGAIQRLDLRRLVQPKHQRALGRAHASPDDVAHLPDEQRGGGELEGLASMRLGDADLFRIASHSKTFRAAFPPGGACCREIRDTLAPIPPRHRQSRVNPCPSSCVTTAPPAPPPGGPPLRHRMVTLMSNALMRLIAEFRRRLRYRPERRYMRGRARDA